MAASRQRIAILISGRGSNMEAILRNVREGVLKDLCEVALVFSNRAGAPGLAKARELGFATECLEPSGMSREDYDARLLALLEPYRLDWLVLAGYMRILSPSVVHRYPDRIVNIHPADTRVHHGLDAYRWAFENRLPLTTITVHLVDEGVDTGRIVAQRPVVLTGAQSLEEIEQRGLAVEHSLYSATLARLFRDPAAP